LKLFRRSSPESLRNDRRSYEPLMIDTMLFDIDGILTDGTVYIDSAGEESKKISFDDIDAIFELKRAGIRIGFITGEDNGFTDYVKRRFTPDFFASGCKDKLSWFKALAEKEGLTKEKVGFVGDSKKDVDLLRYLDFTFAPSDADEEIRNSATSVTRAVRGKGVIKEVARFILEKDKGVYMDANRCKESLDEHLEVIRLLSIDNAFTAVVMAISKVLIDLFRRGGRLLICGNGGSAADAQHMATELVSRFLMERKALDVEALTVNTSTLTAIANDYSFDLVFSRQIEAKGRKGDVLLVISTSGNSRNIVEAIHRARGMGLTVIGFAGNNRESPVHALSDHLICVPSGSVARVQEAHILIGHIICEIVEKELFSTGG
jgi:D-sedoheptulose 7-phosphate isomerase